MATDWAFYFLVQPSGLAAIAFAIAFPFLFWRAIVGKAIPQVGYFPLAAGYAGAFVGLIVLNLILSYFEVDARVARGVFLEAQRWRTVSGWTLYMTVLSLLFVLPLIGLVGVPLSAILVRTRRLTFSTMGITVTGLWLLLAVLGWLFPSNEWHRQHRLESLYGWLGTLLPGAFLVGIPFFLCIYRASRGYHHAET